MSNLRTVLKYVFLLSVGGIIYCIFETAFRGYTHVSMLFVGGICFVLCGLMNEIFDWMTPLIIQMLSCALLITVVEFVSGLILNVWLRLNVWDYSNLRFNILGQICPQFTILWFFLSAAAIILDDFIRWIFCGEEKPSYVIF